MPIPEFEGEMNPNPVTALDMVTADGTLLWFAFVPPIQQSRMMWALGRLHAELGVSIDLQLPEQGLNEQGKTE